MSPRRSRGGTLRGSSTRTRQRARQAIVVDVSRDGGRGGIGVAAARRTAEAVLRAEGVKRATLSVTFLADARMTRLNARLFRKRRLTDVIAFGLAATPGPHVGDVYIAPGAARRSAREHGVPVRNEMIRLIVHGVLHTLGYDHPDGMERLRSPMWARQERLVARLSGGAPR